MPMIKHISLTTERYEAIQTLATDRLPTVQTKLAASANGLTQIEARAGLGRYGYNEIPEKAENSLRKFLSHFGGLRVWMIVAAAILSALIGRWADSTLIIVLLIVYGTVRFLDEGNAGTVIATLKTQGALRASVKREGRWRAIPARELVPGDIVRLRVGDIVPADVRVFDGDPAQVDLIALTGKSLPVMYKVGDVVYTGSAIKQGAVNALVYATGKNTYFGPTVYLRRSGRKASK